MTTLSFENFEFQQQDNSIRFKFLKIFYFDIKKEELNNIAEFTIKKNSISFKNISEIKANNKFNSLLIKHFPQLKNKLTKNNTVYIHQNSNIPLIGTNYFGIIDRNTNIIEIKPITGCNLDCIYCSVDLNKRKTDFVVEKDYIIKELKQVIKEKQNNNIEAHIGTQGEPFLYADLIPLIKEIKQIKEVKRISIDTNATLLTKDLINDLVKAGLTQFNISINAITPELAKKIANQKHYNIENVKTLTEYAAQKADVIIAPVLIPNINDKEMPKIINFAKKIKTKHKLIVGIQNFLNYKLGKNPAKQYDWDKFKTILKNLEKEHNIKLLLDFKEDFNIQSTLPLKKPFKKNDIIKAEIVCEGRLKNEMIAVARNRCITLPQCLKDKGKITIKIVRTKHNVFIGASL